MKNSVIKFETLYEIIRDYFTGALPHFASQDADCIVQPFLDKVMSYTKVRGPGLHVISEGSITHPIDEVLRDATKRKAFVEDIDGCLRWLSVSGYLTWNGSGNGSYRATEKLLQVKKIENL
ncbi:hypothetical protein [Pantoea agglomerans]|jgi:hypothetical protein|uniref:hypothetical protein n=1 Tax=Enterobacter agglomerans TaxID=549 RepID=UPI003C7C9BDA